ncbi:MAG: hypothetical protein A3E01_00020 [Gammaproteobacteria bacterium RIFCSPHIGHO2_12_FULL_63_22]|nr:MAG: hypothetical protein A3E01_00020 [Gammaproteobacteria bacterium RIFCSPHIGHO2_12_FULL_63_22]
MPEIHVFLRVQWGKRRIFPACPIAGLFAEIAGESTLTSRNIEIIKKLGYRVIVDIPADLPEEL